MMDNLTYCNDLMARMEELFFHELSDCAGWKTEFIGVDFIQAQNIKGENRDEIIGNCLKAITRAGLAKESAYAVAGQDVLLRLKVTGCAHLGKEVRLKFNMIKARLHALYFDTQDRPPKELPPLRPAGSGYAELPVDV